MDPIPAICSVQMGKVRKYLRLKVRMKKRRKKRMANREEEW
jgi:hypothetical protein